MESKKLKIGIYDKSVLERGVLYILLKNNEPVYIGRSTCVRARVRVHANEGKKDFDRFIIIEPESCNSAGLGFAETIFIIAIDTKYNVNITDNAYMQGKTKIANRLFDGKKMALNKVLKKHKISQVWEGFYLVDKSGDVVKDAKKINNMKKTIGLKIEEARELVKSIINSGKHGDLSINKFNINKFNINGDNK